MTGKQRGPSWTEDANTGWQAFKFVILLIFLALLAHFVSVVVLPVPPPVP